MTPLIDHRPVARASRTARLRLAALSAVAAATALAAVAAPPGQARLLKPVPHECRPAVSPCTRVANAFIRADVNPLGAFSLGTTGGDPSTPLDDDKGLLYGFVPGGASNTGSSYVTVRIQGPAGIDDFYARSAADDVVEQVEDARTVRTVWRRRAPYRVTVTHTLQAVRNPYSGRDDLLDMAWDIRNDDAVDLEIGLRSLLDVQIAGNDGAPYFIPGVGTQTLERRFSGDQVPPFWIAFEARDFDPSRLRSFGLLRGDEVTTPDELVLANWRRIQEQPFTYDVDPTRVITGDSAVALYWSPRPVPARAALRLNARYGEAANQGGRAFVTAPLQAECGTTFSAALFVSNFDLAPLNAGVATLALPPGVAVAPGQAASQPLGDIPSGETRSVVWQLDVAPGTVGPRRLVATAVFAGGQRFDAEANVTVQCAAPPTAPPPPTPTAPPAATATPGGAEPGVCDWIIGRVPQVAIDTALADPSRVYGWNMPQNPNRAVSPFNPLRRWLSLGHRGVPYHPVNNTLVFKAGCP